MNITRQMEKRDRRTARIANRIQSGPPFRINSEVTGLPNHEYAMMTKTVKRRGRKKYSFRALAHLSPCVRCAAENLREIEHS